MSGRISGLGDSVASHVQDFQERARTLALNPFPELENRQDVFDVQRIIRQEARAFLRRFSNPDEGARAYEELLRDRVNTLVLRLNQGRRVRVRPPTPGRGTGSPGGGSCGGSTDPADRITPIRAANRLANEAKNLAANRGADPDVQRSVKQAVLQVTLPKIRQAGDRKEKVEELEEKLVSLTEGLLEDLRREERLEDLAKELAGQIADDGRQIALRAFGVSDEKAAQVREVIYRDVLEAIGRGNSEQEVRDLAARYRDGLMGQVRKFTGVPEDPGNGDEGNGGGSQPPPDDRGGGDQPTRPTRPTQPTRPTRPAPPARLPSSSRLASIFSGWSGAAIVAGVTIPLGIGILVSNRDDS